MDWEAHPNFDIDLVQLDTKTFFFCKPNPSELVSSFFDALVIVATQSKTQEKMNFLQNGTAMKSRLAAILQALNQRGSHCADIKA